MALLRTRLFAGHLFAGALFGALFAAAAIQPKGEPHYVLTPSATIYVIHQVDRSEVLTHASVSVVTAAELVTYAEPVKTNAAVRRDSLKAAAIRTKVSANHQLAQQESYVFLSPSSTSYIRTAVNSLFIKTSTEVATASL